MSKFKYKIYIVLAIVWMIFIFINSAMEGGTSSGFSAEIINFLVRVIKTLGDSDTVTKLISAFESDGFHLLIRKTAHFVEFGILGMLYTAGLGVFQKIKGYHLKRFFIALGLSVVYAITDEVHQLFVYGRVGSAVDVLIDSFGAGLFSLILILIIHKKSNRALKVEASRLDQ